MNVTLHLHGRGKYEISIRLEDNSMAGRLDHLEAMLTEGLANIMSAMDDMNAAIDEAVAAMKHAATTIENGANNDPQLRAAAARLHDAAAALETADPADAPDPNAP